MIDGIDHEVNAPMSLRDHLGKVLYFQAVCEAGTFRKAAERLRLTQSSLTVAVQKLEESLDEPLLVRTKRGVRPTLAGEMVLAFARDLGHRIDDVEAQLRAPSGTAAGHVRFGAYDSIAVYWLPKALRQLGKQFPHLTLSIQVGSSASLIERVQAGSVDLGLVIAPPDDGRLELAPLFRDHFSVFSTREGRSGPLIGMFGARVSEDERLGGLLVKRGIDTAGALDVESFEIAKSLALQDVGPAVLPHRVAEVGLGRTRLKKVRGYPSAFGPHTIALVMPKAAHQRSPLAALVAGALRALA